LLNYQWTNAKQGTILHDSWAKLQHMHLTEKNA
jgi:hypothetical protein